MNKSQVSETKGGAGGVSTATEPLDAEGYDILSPSHVQDPFPLYARLREEHPIYWDQQYSFWLLTRYADVKAALQAPIKFSSATGVELEGRAENFPPTT